jgi:2-hydroxy-3-oxopropionate reductase
VLATAHQADVPLPLSAGLYEIMTALKNMGCLDNDHSGIVKYYERLAGVEVRPQ